MRSTADYLHWQQSATNDLLTQRGKLSELCYWSSQILIPASKTSADLDNVIKAIHDILVKNKRVPDDRYNVSIRVQFWGGDNVVIAVTQEEMSKWTPIKKPSKSLLRRLTQHSR